MFVVRINDPLNQWVAYYVTVIKAGDADAFDAVEHFKTVFKARIHTSRQVDLGNVAGNHGLRAKANPGQEHFHLFFRGVLTFIENHKRMAQSPTTHVSQWGDLNLIAFNHLGNGFKTQHLVQSVV